MILKTRSRVVLWLLCLTVHNTVWAVIPQAELLAVLQQRLQNDALLLYRQMVKNNQELQPLAQQLAGVASDTNLDQAVRVQSYITLAKLHWRDGDNTSALATVELALALGRSQEQVGELHLLKGRLLDSMGRQQDALAVYQAALIGGLPEQDQAFVQRRLSLFANQQDSSQLIQLANNQDQSVKNKAAVILALKGQYAQALSLYRISDAEESYIGHTRIAEWALKANDYPLAQQQAWLAMTSTEVDYQQKYAMALLLEAYRNAGQLEQVSQLLAQHTQSAIVFDAHIDVLVERRQYNQAISQLQSIEQTLTPVQHSRLLSLYQSAQRLDEVAEEYQNLIAAQPHNGNWYIKLAQHYSNIGEGEKSASVWRQMERQNQNNMPVLLAGAEAMLGMGLTDEAIVMLNRHKDQPKGFVQAQMFLFETFLSQQDLPKAEAELSALLEKLRHDAAQRIDVADGFERINKPLKSLAIYQALQQQTALSFDHKAHMAGLYTQLGQKQQALEVWQQIWQTTDSPAQVLLAGERWLSLAEELAELPNIVAQLQAKVAQQTANKNDFKLLLRIYLQQQNRSAVNNILVKIKQSSQLPATDKLYLSADIFQQIGDWPAYQQTLQQLIEVEPEYSSAHLSNILLSKLNNPSGETKAQYLQDIQRALADASANIAPEVKDEFTANILFKAGFIDLAIDQYNKLIALYPKHIDKLLLLTDLLLTKGEHQRALAKLQYIAEFAENDDEFVIAIDGMLNIISDFNDKKQQTERVQPLYVWMQRMILQRVADNADKFYLYRLLADVAGEVKLLRAKQRALENALPIANTRRSFLLRELIGLSSAGSGMAGQTRRLRNTANKLLYGRRLARLDTDLPPDVYLNLASDLLLVGEPLAADNAFHKVNDITGVLDLNKIKAQAFLDAGYADIALNYYNAALNLNQQDIELLKKNAQLREQNQQDTLANKQYWRALSLLLQKQPEQLETEQIRSAIHNDTGRYNTGVNSDPSKTRDFVLHYENLIQGLIATWPQEQEQAEQRQQQIVNLISAEISRISSNSKLSSYLHYPRLRYMSQMVRRVSEATNSSQLAIQLDVKLADIFADDAELYTELNVTYGNWFAPSLQPIQQVIDIYQNSTETGEVKSRQNSADTEPPEVKEYQQAVLAEVKSLAANGQFQQAIKHGGHELSPEQIKAVFTVYIPRNKQQQKPWIDLAKANFSSYQLLQSYFSEPILPSEILLNLSKQPIQEYHLDAYLDLIPSQLSVEQRLSVIGRLLAQPLHGVDQLKLVLSVRQESLNAAETAQLQEYFQQIIAKLDLTDAELRQLLVGYLLETETHPSQQSMLVALSQTLSQDYDFGFALAKAVDAVHRGEVLNAMAYVSQAPDREALAGVLWPLAELLPEQADILAATDLTKTQIDFLLGIKRLGVRVRNREPNQAYSDFLEAYLLRFSDDKSKQLALMYQYWLQQRWVDFSGALRQYITQNPDELLASAVLYQFYLQRQNYPLALQLNQNTNDKLSSQTVQQSLAKQVQEQLSNKTGNAVLADLYLAVQKMSYADLIPTAQIADKRQVLVNKQINQLLAKINSADANQQLRGIWRQYVNDAQATPEPDTDTEALVTKIKTFTDLSVSPDGHALQAQADEYKADGLVEILLGQNSAEPVTHLLDVLLTSPTLVTEWDKYLQSLAKPSRHQLSYIYQALSRSYWQLDLAEQKISQLSAQINKGLNDHQLSMLLSLVNASHTKVINRLLATWPTDIDNSNFSRYQLLLLGRVTAFVDRPELSVDYFVALASRLLQVNDFPQVLTHAKAGNHVIGLLTSASRVLPHLHTVKLYQRLIKQVQHKAQLSAAKPLDNAFIVAATRIVFTSDKALRHLQTNYPEIINNRASLNPYVLTELTKLFAQAGKFEQAWFNLQRLLQYGSDAIGGDYEMEMMAVQLGYSQYQRDVSVLPVNFVQHRSTFLDLSSKALTLIWNQYISRHLGANSTELNAAQQQELALTLIYQLVQLKELSTARQRLNQLGADMLTRRHAPWAWFNFVKVAKVLNLELDNDIVSYLLQQQLLDSEHQSLVIHHLQQQQDNQAAFSQAVTWFKDSRHIKVLTAMRDWSQRAKANDLFKHFESNLQSVLRAKAKLGSN